MIGSALLLPFALMGADVPPGEYVNPMSALGGGDRAAAYRLRGDAVFGWQTGTLQGAIDLGAFTLTVETGGGNRTALEGALSGAGNLIWRGGGADEHWQTLPSFLGGTAPNTLGGTLTVWKGTLALAKPEGVTAIAGNVVIGGGDNKAILQWEHAHQVADTSRLTLTGAKGAWLKFQGHDEALGVLVLEGDGDIALGGAPVVVRFAESAGAAWAARAQLLVREWKGAREGGGRARLLFGNSAVGLTAAQCGRIGFVDPEGFPEGVYHAAMLRSGEVVSAGTPVVPVDPPYDLAPAARADRAAAYLSRGRENLVAPGTPLRHGMRLSFFGDSITWLSNGASPEDAAVAKRANDFAANGHYYNLLGRALAAHGFGDVALFNHGINGGGVREVEDGVEHTGDSAGHVYQLPFDALLERDEATLAVVYIGINDVWWRGTTPERFERSLRAIMDAARKRGVKLVVATPACRHERPDGTNPDDAKIDRYVEIMRRTARETGVRLVDLRRVFTAYARNYNYEIRLDGSLRVLCDFGQTTYDGVHPTDFGAALIADHIAQGICDALQSGDSH